MPQRDVELRRVNVFRNVRRNPVCDENALDINMDQSGSTVKNSSPTPIEWVRVFLSKEWNGGLNLQVVAPLFDVRTEIEYNYRGRHNKAQQIAVYS